MTTTESTLDSKEGEPMKVDAQEMWGAVKNATLFCRPKTWNGGEVQIGVEGGVVTVAACDDFVSVVSTVPTTPLERPAVYLPQKALKGLEQALREQEGEVELDLSEATSEAAEPEWWEGFEGVVTELGKRPVRLGALEINPARLTMLSRLEPKDQYPLSMHAFKVEDNQQIVGWKYGPRVFGMIQPLDRKEMEIEEGALW